MADDRELLESLFAAAIGYARPDDEAAADLWPGFLARLAREILADSLGLILAPQDQAGQTWWHGALRDVPTPTDVARMRMDRVYSQIDLPGAGPDPAPLRALRCPLPGGGHVLLLAVRSAADFRAIDAVRLSGLGRMIARALTGWLALRAERARAALDAAVAQGLGVGWMVLNPAGRVLHAPPHVAEDLAPRAGLRVRADGRLDFAEPEMAAALQAASVTAQSSGRTCPLRVTLPDPALRLSVQTAEHLGNPAMILWLRWQKPLRDLPADRVAAAFEMSRSEARLAARIADGMSLAEAANDLGWTLETVRSCSKAIYARMGVGGQTAVALTLRASPAWLSAGVPGASV